MEQVTITVRLPTEIYEKAAEILAGQGLTVEDPIILFIKETVRLGRIPFDYTEEALKEVQRWEKLMDDDPCNV